MEHGGHSRKHELVVAFRSSPKQHSVCIVRFLFSFEFNDIRLRNDTDCEAYGLALFTRM